MSEGDGLMRVKSDEDTFVEACIGAVHHTKGGTSSDGLEETAADDLEETGEDRSYPGDDFEEDEGGTEEQSEIALPEDSRMLELIREGIDILESVRPLTAGKIVLSFPCRTHGSTSRFGRFANRFLLPCKFASRLDRIDRGTRSR